MALEYLFFVSILAQFVGKVRENFELAKKILEYLRMFPEWQIYLKQLDEKTSALDRAVETLSCREADISEELKSEELGSRKKRRREVDAWQENVKRVKNDFETVRQETPEKKYLFRPWLENRVDLLLKDVQDLFEKGKFPEGLFLDVPSTSREPLLTQELVGDEGYVETVLDWLNDSSVQRIGVYGVEGVGKTAVLTHVQSRLSQSDSTDFSHVCWVSVPKEKPCVHSLQGLIAKQVGLDLSGEEDRKRRAAQLHGFLAKRGKCVVIIDDFGKLLVEEVGIHEHCKLVLSGLSLRDCRRIDCHKSLEIKLRSDADSMALFKKKVFSTDNLGLEFEDVLEHVVRECKGLPRRIINSAERLRGVDDISEWRDVLNDMTKN